MAKTKVVKKSKLCWHPGLFPGHCQQCHWLMAMTMKVGKKFIHCPRPEAKQARVWLTKNQVTEEKRRHKMVMKDLGLQLLQYVAELNGKEKA